MILSIIIYFSVFIIINGDHYRGGFITWKPQYPRTTNQNPVAIILKQRHVWRSGFYPCNDSTIIDKVQIGEGYVQCISITCDKNQILATAAGTCVSYSKKNDWSAVEPSTIINITANVTLEAAFKGGAWIMTLGVGGGGTWSISTGISTIPRSDGIYNTPPFSSMSSIKLLRVGSMYTWEIPVADTDGDLTRCRWASRTPVDECADVCNGLPNAMLNSYPCTMTYNATKPGFWVVALKIEDYEFSSQTTPLSSSSIQFIVHVYSNTTGCTTLPFYYGKQPPNTCISVNVGSTINEMAQFSAGCKETSIIEVETYKPDNMIAGDLEEDPFNSSLYTMKITWTPTSSHVGVNLVCYTPLDNTNQQGNQVCIKYFVNDNDPNYEHLNYINGSMKPVGQVYSNQSVWYIQYSSEVRRPNFDAYIRFYAKSTNTQVYQINVRNNSNDVIYSNSNFTFFTSINWTMGEAYYILFDSSLVTDPSVCGPQSPAISDTNYWTFVVIDVNTNCSSPNITLIPDVSSSSSPLIYQESADIYISSSITLHCNNSLSTIIKWTIHNCTTNCSAQINSTAISNYSELFIPAGSLSHGLYTLTLRVTMNISSRLTLSASVYIKITASSIKVNLVQFGTSTITHSDQQDLVLNPGAYSIDPNRDIFDASNWKYKYYCRMYNLSMFQGLFVPIDPLNPSCSNENSAVETLSFANSSLTISAGSLLSNGSYQFMVYMKNRENSSIHSTGYLFVNIRETDSHSVTIACVIQKMCHSKSEYQWLNPTTQLALFSICRGTCATVSNITWNIYQGSDLSTDVVRWARLNATDLYENIWIFGKKTKNLTISKQFFTEKSQIEYRYWKFEVVYSFSTVTTFSTLDFVINPAPQNGSCSIYPFAGTTSTLFNISCTDWFDEDGISDYSVYVWTTDPTQRLMIAFAVVPDFQIQLPAGDENTFLVNIIMHIRDKFHCITKRNMTSVIVQPDIDEVSALMTHLENSIIKNNSDPIIRFLIGKNQSTVGQVAILLPRALGETNMINRYNVLSTGVPATSIFVSPLGSSNSQRNSTMHQSTLDDYIKLLNIYAKIRDDLIKSVTNFAILGLNSIKLQGLVLVELTRSVDQLTRITSILASERCHQLAQALYSMATEIPYEDAYEAATLIVQCTSNVMTTINGPLHQRLTVLDLDWQRANRLPTDSHPDEIQKDRNRDSQQQMSLKINKQTIETVKLLTFALNIHLNIGQCLSINTSFVFMTLRKMFLGSLSTKFTEEIENARISISRNFTTNLTNDMIILIRAMIESLAFADQYESNMNLSRSVSFSMFDENNYELPIRTTLDNPIELMISRDPNLIIPPMVLQNVISTNDIQHNHLFYLKVINITSILPISVHFEIHPLNKSLAYLFIYKFDHSPILNSSMHITDGWSALCPLKLVNDSLYTHFIDNQRTISHHSVVFGIREFNSREQSYICSNQSIMDPPITNERISFTANYELRVYTSGCYYLDPNNHWQSDGLVVSLFDLRKICKYH